MIRDSELLCGLSKKPKIDDALGLASYQVLLRKEVGEHLRTKQVL